MGGRVAIAATGPVSLAAGREVALAGGNAVDVAVAAAMAAMSTEPGIVSLAGGAFVSVWPADGDPVVIDGNVEMPGRGLPAERFGGGVHEVVTDYGGGVRMFAGHGSVATPGRRHRLPARGRGARRRCPGRDVVAPAARGLPRRLPRRRRGGPLPRPTRRTRCSGATPRPSASSPAPTGRRSSPATWSPTTPWPTCSTSWRTRARRCSPRARSAGRWSTTWRPTVASSPTATSRSTPPLVRPPVRRTVGDWDLAVNPPPSVGGPMLAVMLGELGRRGNWHWPDIIEIQRSVLRYRRDVHDLAARPRRRGPRAAALRRPARPGRAADELEHRQRLRRRPRRHGLRHHRLERLRRRDHRARHRDAAQQRPRGARAQQARPAPARPGHPARVEHGAHDGAHRATAGCSPSARRAPTGSRPRSCSCSARAACTAPTSSTPSRHRGCTCASTRTASPVVEHETRCRHRRRGARGRAARGATTASSRCSSVGWGRPTGARTASLQAAGDPRREAAVAVLDALTVGRGRGPLSGPRNARCAREGRLVKRMAAKVNVWSGMCSWLRIGDLSWSTVAAPTPTGGRISPLLRQDPR